MANTYTLIASNTLGASAASVTFSAIPATFTDLVLRVSGRTTSAGTVSSGFIQMNSVTSTYSSTFIRGDGASATSSRESGDYAGFYLGGVVGGGATSNTFSSHEFYFPNYTVATAKPVSQFSVNETNATTAYIFGIAHLCSSTAAISSLTINLNGGVSFVSGSSFYLYGIKNS
jgi:hypothetical protein